MDEQMSQPGDATSWPYQVPMLAEGLIGPINLLMEDGYHFVPGAVTPRALAALSTAMATLPFRPARQSLGGVVQQFEECRINFRERITPQVSVLYALALHIAWGVHEADARSLGRWRNDELAIQRYPTCDVGISPHRDFASDQLLVAVLNLSGRATFNILEDDRATLRDSWDCWPGDLVLLAGADAGSDHDRPVHSVTNVVGPRISLAYRMTA